MRTIFRKLKVSKKIRKNISIKRKQIEDKLTARKAPEYLQISQEKAEKYREDLKNSEEVIASAINTLKFQTNPLNNKVGDDEELLAFVTSSVKTCDSLAPKKKPVARNKNKNNRHAGHDH